MTRTRAILLIAIATGCKGGERTRSELGSAAVHVAVVERVELQPLAAQAARVVEALDDAGAPLPAADRDAVRGATSPAALQQVLDRHALVVVEINPEQRVNVKRGPAAAQLDENGWRTFLVKVINHAGTTAPLRASSPQAGPIYRMAFPDNKTEPTQDIGSAEVANRWLAIELHDRAPLAAPELSGLEVEYRVVHLYCTDRDGPGGALAAGPHEGKPFKREATLEFDVGAGTADLAHRSGVPILFSCAPSSTIKLGVHDEADRPTTASFVITGSDGRTYPAKARRLAPDFFFHPQVYRADGESVELPAGSYTIAIGRGPEYLTQQRELVVGDNDTGAFIITKVTFRLERWIDPASAGWISGDHHIHAAGCVHYEVPTIGVTAQDMWRHQLGEDLKVGAVLTWGPGFYHQKKFFTGEPHPLSTATNVLRYDLEVSGFGSHKAGHLVLLGLRQHDYPGTQRVEDWPHLGLETLRWAKAQGAVTGAAHTGWGLEIKDTSVPSFEMPKFDGIGAVEFVVQVTHQVPGPDGKLVPAIDFLSAIDTPYPWELSLWYHVLNAGFRTRAAGETDFPCITDDRVGLGRSYVKLDKAAPVDFDAWRRGLAAGRSYVSDGMSHILDLRVDGVEVGVGASELALPRAGKVRVSARVAAMLPVAPDREIAKRPVDQLPYWHLERARIGETRDVAVELVINGVAVAKQTIVADGSLRDLVFDGVAIERSSWVALRVLPSSHTNPVFVVVGGKPIRASKRSAQWLADAVEVVWKQKSPTYLEREQAAARAAYDHARQTYRRIIAESVSP